MAVGLTKLAYEAEVRRKIFEEVVCQLHYALRPFRLGNVSLEVVQKFLEPDAVLVHIPAFYPRARFEIGVTEVHDLLEDPWPFPEYFGAALGYMAGQYFANLPKPPIDDNVELGEN